MQKKLSMKELLEKSKADRIKQAPGHAVTTRSDEQQATNDNDLVEHQPSKKNSFDLKQHLKENRKRKERQALALTSIDKIQAQEDEQAEDGTSTIAPPPVDDEVDDASDNSPLTHAARDKSQKIARHSRIATDIVPCEARPYPVHAFGSMADAVMLIATAVQVSIEMAGSSLLAVLAALCQAIINVSAKASGSGCPVSINILINALSGDRKSSTSSAITKPIYKAIRHATDSRRQMVVEDVTVDGMVVGLIERCPSQFLLALEGAALLGGHAMKPENLGRFLANVSSLYSGEAISRIRKDQHYYAEDRRISLAIYTQPIVTMAFLSSEMVMQQGFGNRFLYSHPASMLGSRQFSDVELDDEPIYKQYCEKMTEIANLPWEINEHTGGVETRTVRLSPRAKTIWVDFYNALELASGPGGDRATHAGYVTRFPEQVLRIAALLAMADNPHVETISEDVMVRATELGHYYLDSALRAFNVAPANKNELDAETLLGWMRNKQKELEIPAIPVRMMYRHGPRCARPTDRTKALLSILESRGDVMQYTKPVAFDGKRSLDNYIVTGM